jgi:hypothetical protein
VLLKGSVAALAEYCLFTPPSWPTNSHTPPLPSGMKMPSCWSGCVVVVSLVKPSRIGHAGGGGRPAMLVNAPRFNPAQNEPAR